MRTMLRGNGRAAYKQQKEFEMAFKTKTLLHPLHNVPTVAEIVDFYRDPAPGRNAGLVLQFPDGHTASMTYDEIKKAIIKAEEVAA